MASIAGGRGGAPGDKYQGEDGGEDTRWSVMILVAALFACEVGFAWRPRVDVGIDVPCPAKRCRFFFSGRPTVLF